MYMCCQRRWNIHHEAEKRTDFFARISFHTWQKLIFLHKESRSIKLQFRLFNLGMRKEFCSYSDIEHYKFTSQVMKLMITG